ncbi:subtilisin-like protein [Ophiobolus disseminans]|uniref:Subtilisin-like protein n=1 Tax=Ophiobolus disseminans TaxID=1469910 RepID=A0A6A6ZMC9_9PLEO|nr:subtilisin-like protein [Ophiobolus disseminans]
MRTHFFNAFLVPLLAGVASLGSAQRTISTSFSLSSSSSSKSLSSTIRNSNSTAIASSSGSRNSTVVLSTSSRSASSSFNRVSRSTQSTSQGAPAPTTRTATSPQSVQSSGLPPFVVPTVTSTVSISIKFSTPTSSPTGSAGTIVVTNPRNPQESVSFAVNKVPEDQRVGLPGDVSDAAPLALLLLGFSFPVLLFSGFTIVFPIADAGVLAGASAWLALSDFPTPKKLENDSDDDSDDNSATPSPTSRATSLRSSSVSKSSSASSSRSSSAASGTPTQFIIYPKSGNSALVQELSANLTRDLGKDKVLNSIGDGAVDFWVASMDEKYAEAIRSKSFIAAVEPDILISIDDPSETSRSKREVSRDAFGSSVSPTKARPVVLPRATNSAGYEEQLKPKIQLGGVSGTFVQDRYLYRPAAGAGVTIYIVDTGVAINSIKGQSFGATDYIFPAPLTTFDRNTPDDAHGHGTCVAAMAADEEFGIAKKATIKPVKLKIRLSPDNLNSVQLELSSFLGGFEKVLKDIRDNNRQGKAVVNLSAFVRHDDMIPEGLDRIKQLIGDIMNEDVPFIVAAGNSAQTTTNIDTHPQLFEGPNFPIINVGAVDNDGKEAVFSQKGPHLNVHAFGDGVTCRDTSGHERNGQQGTSFARTDSCPNETEDDTVGSSNQIR